MASLIEKLVNVLEQENDEYTILVDLSNQKTPVLIRGDLKQLGKITDEEQNVVGRINKLEKERSTILNDIANVVNRDVKNLKLVNLIQMLEKKPEEQKPLVEVHAKLQTTLKAMKMVNEHNQSLIQSSLEMVSYDLNLLRAMKSAPETANYTRNAYTTGEKMGVMGRSFDTCQ